MVLGDSPEAPRDDGGLRIRRGEEAGKGETNLAMQREGGQGRARIHYDADSIPRHGSREIV